MTKAIFRRKVLVINDFFLFFIREKIGFQNKYQTDKRWNDEIYYPQAERSG